MDRARPVLALLLLWCTAAAAAPHTSEVRLHHRPAAAVLPVIKPFAAADGAVVGGSGHTVMLQGDPAAVADLTRLIHRLDVPLRRLVITVSTLDHGPSPTSTPGTALYSSRRPHIGDTAGDQIEDTRPLKQGYDRRLPVVEGHWANVSVTWHVPEIRQQVGINGGGGAQVFNGLYYRDVTTGIAVRPVLMDDEVTLTVRVQRRAPAAGGAGGAAATEGTATTVSGRLGQWLEISGADDALDLSTGGTIQTADWRAPLYIRIDALKH